MEPVASVVSGHTLAQAIVDTIREPLLVLDKELRVVAASRSFLETFGMDHREVHGRLVFALGEGQWDIPELRVLLERILPEQRGVEAFEVERNFAGLGRRTMLLNARTVFYETMAHKMILLAMADVTAWRAAETAMKELLQQKEFLLEEMQRRVANSLEIIASILLLKARAVQSEETRQHLQDAHKRVMSVAAVQEQLEASRHGETVEVGPYLVRLCETLASSVIAERRTIAVGVSATGGKVKASDAVSLGLIVTELVINAVKHGLPAPRADGKIAVDYRVDATGWTLEVSDNGVGFEGGVGGVRTIGLGTSIVEALASKLGAGVEISSDTAGTRVSIRHCIPDDTRAAT